MNIRRRAASGIIWVGVSTLSIQLFSLIASVLLARLLQPSDFGLVTLAMVVISLSNIFSELGFGGTIVQFRKVDQRTSDTAFYLNLWIAIFLAALVFAASGPIAGLMNAAQLSPILKVLALNILLTSIRVVPSNLLERELEFRRKAVAEVTPTLLYGLVAMGGALLGWGVWSLVIGMLVSTGAQTLLFWAISSYRPSLNFEWKTARELWRFGRHLVSASLLLFLAANLDQVYIGRFIDVSQVGFYGLALSLGNLSTDYVANLFGRVLFPAFSRIQAELRRLKDAYLTSVRYISYLAIPLCFGIFAVAPAAVLIIYSSKWAASIPLIRILCFYGLFRSLGRLAGTLFSSVGKPAVSVQLILLRLLVLVILIVPLGSRWGAAGVAITLTLSMASSVLWSFQRVNSLLNIPTGQFLGQLAPQLSAGLLMGAGVTALARLLPVSLPALIVMVAGGVSAYALLLLLFGRSRVVRDGRDILALLLKQDWTIEPPAGTEAVQGAAARASEETRL